MDREQVHSGPGASYPASAGVGAPLFHAAWLFAFGIAVAHFIWLRPSYLLIALAPIAILCGIAAVREQRIVWLPLGVMWCMLGAWCAEMQPQPAPDAGLSTLSDGLVRTIEGTVTDSTPVRTELEQNVEGPSAAQPTQQLDVLVSSVEVVTDSDDVQRPARGGLRITVRWAQGELQPREFGCGERIRADVRMLMPQNYRDPGAWSRSAYLLDRGITSVANVSADRIQLLGSAARMTLRCRFARWQHTASARLLGLVQITKSLPPQLRVSPDDAIMLAAIVTGDRTYLSHSLRAGFERTGSFHMLVVSGLHLGIVSACILWICKRLRMPHSVATIITILASFGYAFFTGFATPVQRSLWMVTLYLLARLVYREGNVLNTIGFASLCLLAASPRALFEPSLQMTVLAVVSIGGIALPLLENTVNPYLRASRGLSLIALDVKLPPKQAQFRVMLRMFAAALSRALGRRIGWSLFPWIARTFLRCIEAVVVSCVIEIAMALPMAMYFHRITVFALPVNMLILPLLLLLMPCALITLATSLLLPVLASIPAALTAFLLHFAVGVVHMFGSLSHADFRIPEPLPVTIGAFCLLLGLAVALAQSACSTHKSWQRHLAWAFLVLASTAVVMPRPVQHPHNALLVEAIDVGQGDSILVITPDGKTMLIDGGGFGGGPRQSAQDFDIGEEVVSPVLWERGIRHLDVVALSHAHSDHMGGLPAVLQNFSPDELWVGNNPPVAAYASLLEKARALHVTIRRLQAGDSTSLGNANIRVLAPQPEYQPQTEPNNNDSLVLHVEYKATSVLLEGDAEAPIEQDMLHEQALESTLLKIGHHGSVSSTRPEFLARVAPKWAAISCGLHNRFGHPRPEVLQELQDAHVHTLSTDINGASCFLLDGKDVTFEAFCGMRRTSAPH